MRGNLVLLAGLVLLLAACGVDVNDAEATEVNNDEEINDTEASEAEPLVDDNGEPAEVDEDGEAGSQGGDPGDDSDDAAELEGRLSDLEADVAGLTERMDGLDEMFMGDPDIGEDGDWEDDWDDELDEPADAAGVVGDRDDPIGVGDTASLSEWDVTVLDSLTDITDDVLEANQFNDPPADGNAFYAARVEVTYTGSASDSPWLSLSFDAVGDAATAYSTNADSCGSISDGINDVGELFPDGTDDGFVCWEIPDDDAETVVLRVEESFMWEDSAAWMHLQ